MSLLRREVITVIRSVLEYAAPVWHHLITKTQADQIEAIQKRAIRIIYTCTHDMPYLSATFVADLSTMSDRMDQLSRKFLQFHSTAYFPSTQSSSFPSRPTTHHSPTSNLKIPPDTFLFWWGPEQKSISPFSRMP